MNAKLRNIFNNNLNMKVPVTLNYIKIGFPSLKPLVSWVQDNFYRIEFISN